MMSIVGGIGSQEKKTLIYSSAKQMTGAGKVFQNMSGVFVKLISGSIGEMLLELLDGMVPVKALS